MVPVIWLLGLSGSGKTTLGSLLRIHLESQGHDVEFIDADKFRREHGHTGFSPEARRANISAIRDYALQCHSEGKVVIVSAITPYADMRRENRRQIPLYREVWVRCGLETLVERDTKKFYAKAAAGEMDLLTGVSDAFDEPTLADMVIDTDQMDMADCYTMLRDLAEEAIEEGESLQEMGMWHDDGQFLTLMPQFVTPAPQVVAAWPVHEGYAVAVGA